MVVSLRFLGGNGTVTGSKTLIEHDGRRILVDCGLFQGGRELRQLNRDPFPLDPGSVDAVVLTHAHLDHCGHVPLLVTDGFAGRIHATTDTTALAAIVLPDSGRLQEEEAAHARRHGWSRHAEPRPLYTEADAEFALDRFTSHELGATATVADDIEVVFHPSGHILGSAIVEVRLPGGITLVFSGDLGRGGHPLLVPPAALPASDVVTIESTYGDAHHEPASRSLDRLARAVRDTARRGGRVVIPAFAVDRTEIVLDALDDLTRAGEVPELPVFVDSPMALEALAVYRAAVQRGAPDVLPDVADAARLFSGLDLRSARTVEESKAIDASRYPCVVVSASGMAAGGRVLHHLAATVGDPRATVVLAGFQAEGTRGRALRDGARSLKLFGRYLPVRAQVVDLPGLSQHADQDGLISWLRDTAEPPSTVFVNHGEPAASAALAARIGDELGLLAVIPHRGERAIVVPAR